MMVSVLLIPSPLLLQVGHVQQVSLVPDRTHQMMTLSLKPLLFGKYGVVVSGCDLLLMNNTSGISSDPSEHI